jgi:hypothetical protein
MAMRMLGLLGLIGGTLALVGIFTPWATASYMGLSESLSGWDCIKGDGETYCYLAFAGALVALLGALSSLAAPRAKALWTILAIGGILAIVGAAWAFSDIETGTMWGMSVSYGFGLYLTLVGGILALIGSLSLLKE